MDAEGAGVADAPPKEKEELGAGVEGAVLPPNREGVAAAPVLPAAGVEEKENSDDDDPPAPEAAGVVEDSDDPPKKFDEDGALDAVDGDAPNEEPNDLVSKQRERESGRGRVQEKA